MLPTKPDYIVLTDDSSTCHVGLHALVQDVKTELSTPTRADFGRLLNVLRVTLAGATAVLGHRRQPGVKLRYPVLQGVDGNDDERTAGVGETQEDVDEANDLQRLAEPHAVCQDTAEAGTRPIVLQRLHDVVVQKPNTTNLPAHNAAWR